jgi:hypothetical protein
MLRDVAKTLAHFMQSSRLCGKTNFALKEKFSGQKPYILRGENSTEIDSEIWRF